MMEENMARLTSNAAGRNGLTAALISVAVAVSFVPATAASADGGWVITVGVPESTLTQSWAVGYMTSIDGGAVDCEEVGPGNALNNKYAAGGRMLPNGITVTEPGSISASGDPQTDADGYASGSDDLSITNWGSYGIITITVHCTTDSAQWYVPDGG